MRLLWVRFVSGLCQPQCAIGTRALHHGLDRGGINSSIGKPVQEKSGKPCSLCETLCHDEFFVRMDPATPNAERVDIRHPRREDIIPLADTASINETKLQPEGAAGIADGVKERLLGVIPGLRWAVKPAMHLA